MPKYNQSVVWPSQELGRGSTEGEQWPMLRLGHRRHQGMAQYHLVGGRHVRITGLCNCGLSQMENALFGTPMLVE